WQQAEYPGQGFRPDGRGAVDQGAQRHRVECPLTQQHLDHGRHQEGVRHAVRPRRPWRPAGPPPGPPPDSAARMLPRPPIWWTGDPVAYTASWPVIPVSPARTALRFASTRWVSGTRLSAPVGRAGWRE